LEESLENWKDAVKEFQTHCSF
jgi:hypothetical protein